MRLPCLMAVMALTLSAGALAADSTERTAPQDRKPACMDRKTDSSAGDCVVKDEGTPRHRYPTQQVPGSAAPAPLPASGATVPSTVRKAPAASR